MITELVAGFAIGLWVGIAYCARERLFDLKSKCKSLKGNDMEMRINGLESRVESLEALTDGFKAHLQKLNGEVENLFDNDRIGARKEFELEQRVDVIESRIVGLHERNDSFVAGVYPAVETKTVTVEEQKEE